MRSSLSLLHIGLTCSPFARQVIAFLQPRYPAFTANPIVLYFSKLIPVLVVYNNRRALRAVLLQPLRILYIETNAAC